MSGVTVELIEEAAAILHGVARVTPVMTSRQLDRQSAAQVFLKCENLQRVGAFKFRGAYHAVSKLVTVQRPQAFATISSGNHAQGLALACQLLGATAYLVIPKPFSPLKRAAVASYGGRVHAVDNRVAAETKLSEIVAETHATVVSAFNNPLVIAGQGTIWLELLAQVDEVDALVAPIGGGGLLSGLCVAGHARRPDLEIFACEPAGALDAIESVKENRIVRMDDPHTIADGLCSSLGDQTLPILRKHLTGFFVVQEEEIVAAMQFAYERLKLVIEPSSAVALAPLLRREPRLTGKRVAVIVTGGNVDLSCFWQNLDNRISRERYDPEVTVQSAKAAAMCAGGAQHVPNLPPSETCR